MRSGVGLAARAKDMVHDMVEWGEVVTSGSLVSPSCCSKGRHSHRDHQVPALLITSPIRFFFFFF